MLWIMLSVIMLSINIPSVITLNVIILSVVAPYKISLCHYHPNFLV